MIAETEIDDGIAIVKNEFVHGEGKALEKEKARTVVDGKALEQEKARTGTGSDTNSVVDDETMRTGAT